MADSSSSTLKIITLKRNKKKLNPDLHICHMSIISGISCDQNYIWISYISSAQAPNRLKKFVPFSSVSSKHVAAGVQPK